MPPGSTPPEVVTGVVSSPLLPPHPGAPKWDAPDAEAFGPSMWGMVRRYALLVGVCAALAGAAGMFATARQPKLYEALAAIRVDRQTGQANAIGAPNFSILNALGTELEMLRSRDLARAVVDSLGLRLVVLQGKPGSEKVVPRSSVLSDVAVSTEAPRALLKLVRARDGRLELQDSSSTPVARITMGMPVRVDGVSFRLLPEAERLVPFTLVVRSRDDAVESVKGSIAPARRNQNADIIDIRVRGTDPAMVRDVANATAQLYIAGNQNARQLEAKRSVAFLTDQLTRVSEQLSSAERSLRDYRARAGVINLPAEASTGVNRRAELLAQRNAVDAERVALERMMQATAASGAGAGNSKYRELLAFPTLLRSGAAGGLQSALTAAEQKRGELLTRRTERDEEVQATEARIADLQAQIRDFATTYLQGLTNQVNALDATLSRSDAALATIPEKELRSAELERNAKTTEAAYAMLKARFKEAEIAAAATDASIRMVDAAVMPRRPVSPKPMVNLVMAVLAGVMVGVAGAFLRESSDRSLRTRAQLLALTGSPVLSLIPRLQAVHAFTSRLHELQGRRTALLSAGTHGNSGSPHAPVRPQQAAARNNYSLEDLFGFAESYSRLVTNLGFAGHAQPIQVVLVTSALPGDGKTTVATNLALTLAREGKRVLLVDADLRGGRVDGMLGMRPSAGLGEVLRGQVLFDEAVTPVAAGGGRELYVLSRGVAKADPAGLLASDGAREMLARARAAFDMVVIDTPPVNSVADAALLTRHCDGVLVVARAGVTARDALAFAIEQLRIVRAPVIGAVLNDVDLRGDVGVDGAYRYYGQYATNGSAA